MNRILTSILLFILFSQSVFSQKLKKKVNTYGTMKEVYFIDKKTSFKNGISYILNTKLKDTLSVGSYKNEMRIGIWKYFDFDSGEKFMEYNYTNDSLNYLNNELTADSFLVKMDGKLVYTKVDRPLLFLGYSGEIEHKISKELELPEELLTNEMSASSLLGFTVDKHGNILSGVVLRSFNPSIENQLHKAVMAFNGRMLPPIVNGKAVDSQFYVRFNFNQKAKNQSVKNLPYIYNIGIMVYKKTTVHTEVRRTNSVTRTYPGR